jgi:hypothetical protein
MTGLRCPYCSFKESVLHSERCLYPHRGVFACLGVKVFKFFSLKHLNTQTPKHFPLMSAQRICYKVDCLKRH